jgi:methionyl-tRNA synthetase
MLLHPFMPAKTREMWERLGAGGRVDADWSSLQAWHTEGGARVQSGPPLFPRIEQPA